MKSVFSDTLSLKSILVFIFEITLISFCLHIAMLIRSFLIFGNMFGSTSVSELFEPVKFIVILIAYEFCFYYCDFSIFGYIRSKREYFLKLVETSIWVSITLFVIYFLKPELALGRGVFILNFFTSIPLIFFTGYYLKGFFYTGIFQERIVIIGSGLQAKKIAEEINANPGSGNLLVGYISSRPEKIGLKRAGYSIIGSYSDIFRLVRSENISRIVVAITDRRKKSPINALLKCKLKGIVVTDGTNFLEMLSNKIPIEGLKPSWFIFSEGFNVSRNMATVKRTIDMLCSSVILFVTSPVLLLVAVAIKLDSKGPVIYSQKRVGENGKIFTILKFRSMHEHAKAMLGDGFAEENDPRVSRVGRFIRRTRLDELPQMINVLKGDMSIVGPRPERPHYVAKLREEIPYYTLRLVVKPGITGWAQVRYKYTATVSDTKTKLQYDLYYIKHLSAALDIFILWSTFKVVLTGKGAQ